MPSFFAVSMARSARRGFMMALGSWRRICTPPPSLPWLSDGANPGVSSAGGPSRTMATSGLVRWASERAPRSPTSSWTVPAEMSVFGWPSSLTRIWAAWMAHAIPTRLSNAFAM